MKIEYLLERLKKFNLPQGEFALSGSAPLAIRGIRECKDLDVIVTKKVFEEIMKKFPKIKINNMNCLSIDSLEIGYLWQQSEEKAKELIQDSEIIDGWPYVKLNHIVEWKKFRGTNKDLIDIVHIEEYENKKQFIQEGAEAKVYLQNDTILKDRIPKSYRHPILDEKIRLSRTKREEKILKKAKAANIHVPKVLSASTSSLQLEYLSGEKLSDHLNSYSEEKQESVMKKLGSEVAALHHLHIIHGDLTTSNVILKGNTPYIIDFGLSFISPKIEDMAVDLHVIKQALEAKHFQNHETLFNSFLKEYKGEKTEKVVARLATVEKRGRYKH